MSDFISREAAINELNAEGYTKNMRVHKRLLALPAADVVEVRHGRWIEDGYCGEPCVCSYCGEPCKDTVMGKPRWNYCPMCGAVMDGGQDDV